MSNNTKQNNVRIEKWRTMLKNGLHNDKTLMKSRIKKGIPPSMRSFVWPAIIDLPSFLHERKNTINYHKLLKIQSNNIYEISLDIPRTFPEEQDSKYLRKSLNNVLKALSIVYPEIGYCQGLNFLVLRILQILPDIQSFWLMFYLFENDKCLRYNFINPRALEKQNNVFLKLLDIYLPAIYKKIISLEIALQAFTIKWFMTLYSGLVQKQLFNRIFQVYLTQGWSIIYGVGLVLLQNKQNQIINGSLQSILIILSSSIAQISNIDIFMDKIYSYKLKNQQINDMHEDYEKLFTSMIHMTRRKSIQQRRQINMRIKELQIQDEQIETIKIQNKAQEVNLSILLSSKQFL